MTWHDHRNEGDEPVFWLDGLDIPIVQFLDASFAEHHEEDSSRSRNRTATATRALASTCFPSICGWPAGASPIFNYPYARTREALERMRRAERMGCLPRPEDAVHQPGHRRPRPAPRLARSSSCCPRASPRRRTGRPTPPCSSRSKDRAGRPSAISPCSGGHATCSSCRAGSRFATKRVSDSVLFSFSDRPMQEALSLFREHRGHE